MWDVVKYVFIGFGLIFASIVVYFFVNFETEVIIGSILVGVFGGGFMTIGILIYGSYFIF